VNREGRRDAYYCVVSPRSSGGRDRKFFPATAEGKREAQTFLALKKREIENFGTSAFSLTQGDRAEFLYCREKLAPYGLTLRAAIDSLLPQLSARSKTCTLAALISELLDAKRTDGASERYLKDLRTRLHIFAADFPQATVAEFTPARIDDWLRALPHTPVTRNNYRRLLGVFFNFGFQRGYTLTNPAKGTSRAKQVEKPVGILGVEQAARLLECADAEILPAIALGLFAGLRPESEVWRLDWSRIDFESRLIDIAPDKTKTAQKRFVKMSENLIEWLTPDKRVSGPVSPTGDKYNYLLQRARAAAEIVEWPSDALRHSFGSYHFAHFKNAGETSQELGHADLKMLYKHYRERVKPREAARFWSIRPALAANVVVLTA
jgi:integrase